MATRWTRYDGLRFRRWPHAPAALLKRPGCRIAQILRYVPGDFKFGNNKAFDIADDADHQCVLKILRTIGPDTAVWFLTSHHRARKALGVWVFEMVWCPSRT